MKLCTAPAFSLLTAKALTTAVHPCVRVLWHGPKGDIGVPFFRYRRRGVGVRVCIHLCGCCAGVCPRAGARRAAAAVHYYRPLPAPVTGTVRRCCAPLP